MRLNMAWFVPSSIVSNVTSSSIERSAGGSGTALTGTSERSSTSWYASIVPALARGAEEEYVTEEVRSIRLWLVLPE